jgi:hypothetical protein
MPARTHVAATVKVQLDAGQANPGKVGQSLGHTGINSMAFIAAYNAASAAQRGTVVPVVVTVYDDRSFDLQLKTPPTRDPRGTTGSLGGWSWHRLPASWPIAPRLHPASDSWRAA